MRNSTERAYVRISIQCPACAARADRVATRQRVHRSSPASVIIRTQPGAVQFPLTSGNPQKSGSRRSAPPVRESPPPSSHGLRLLFASEKTSCELLFVEPPTILRSRVTRLAAADRPLGSGPISHSSVSAGSAPDHPESICQLTICSTYHLRYRGTNQATASTPRNNIPL